MKTEIRIDIQDIRIANNSVSQAIEKFCEDSGEIASGAVGPSFSTSGPGSGWSKQHDTGDFAARALADAFGASSYVDSHDGREATLDEEGEVVWSDESVVSLVVPDEADALAYPHTLAAMVSALGTHSAASNIPAWKKLIASIRTAATALSGIDIE